MVSARLCGAALGTTSSGYPASAPVEDQLAVVKPSRKVARLELLQEKLSSTRTRERSTRRWANHPSLLRPGARASAAASSQSVELRAESGPNVCLSRIGADGDVGIRTQDTWTLTPPLFAGSSVIENAPDALSVCCAKHLVFIHARVPGGYESIVGAAVPGNHAIPKTAGER